MLNSTTPQCQALSTSLGSSRSGTTPTLHYVDPMLLRSGNPTKCHEEVLYYLQTMIPPKRFDMFPPLDWGMLRRSRCVAYYVSSNTRTYLVYVSTTYNHSVWMYLWMRCYCFSINHVRLVINGRSPPQLSDGFGKIIASFVRSVVSCNTTALLRKI